MSEKPLIEMDREADKYDATPYHELLDAYLTLCNNAPEYVAPVGTRQESDEWSTWWKKVRPIRIQLNRRKKLQA